MPFLDLSEISKSEGQKNVFILASYQKRLMRIDNVRPLQRAKG